MAAFLLLFFLGASADYQVYTSTDVFPINIPSNAPSTITSTIQVPHNPLGNYVTNVDIVSLKGTHTCISDLTFSLISPSLKKFTFLTTPCTGQGKIPGFDYQINAVTGVGFTCPPPAGLVYVGDENLDVDLLGEQSAGTWTLQIKDGTNTEGGELDGWALGITTTYDVSTNDGGSPTLTNQFSFTYDIVVPPKLYGNYLTQMKLVFASENDLGSDFTLKLTSPSGLTVTLVDKLCAAPAPQLYCRGTKQYAVLGFGATPTCDPSCFTTSLLDAFIGQNSAGTWIVTGLMTQAYTGFINAQLDVYSTLVPTTLTLAASKSPSRVGDNLVLKASVKPALSGLPAIRNGFISFWVDGKLVEILAPNAAGQASVLQGFLLAGHHVVKARYENSDWRFYPSAATLTQTVQPGPTAIKIIFPRRLQVKPKHPLTFTLLVYIAGHPLKPVTGGNVLFVVGGKRVGTAPVSKKGKVIYKIPARFFTQEGAHPLAIRYLASKNYKASVPLKGKIVVKA